MGIAPACGKGILHGMAIITTLVYSLGKISPRAAHGDEGHRRVIVSISEAQRLQEKQSRYDDKQKITTNEERNYNNNNVKKSAQPRFNFFDYSMIPDKDPRAFVPNNKHRKQHEEIF